MPERPLQAVAVRVVQRVEPLAKAVEQALEEAAPVIIGGLLVVRFADDEA